jgi:hypothetical protein
MTILSRPECSANPDVTNALQGVISAAVHFMSSVPGSFGEREQALLAAALQEGGRVALEQELQRIEDALPAEVVLRVAPNGTGAAFPLHLRWHAPGRV